MCPDCGLIGHAAAHFGRTGSPTAGSEPRCFSKFRCSSCDLPAKLYCPLLLLLHRQASKRCVSAVIATPLRSHNQPCLLQQHRLANKLQWLLSTRCRARRCLCACVVCPPAEKHISPRKVGPSIEDVRVTWQCPGT